MAAARPVAHDTGRRDPGPRDLEHDQTITPEAIAALPQTPTDALARGHADIGLVDLLTMSFAR